MADALELDEPGLGAALGHGDGILVPQDVGLRPAQDQGRHGDRHDPRRELVDRAGELGDGSGRQLAVVHQRI